MNVPSRPQNPAVSDAKRDDDLLAGSLVFGRSDHIAELFAKNRRRTPLILWSPEPAEILHPGVRDFSERCLKMSDGLDCIPGERFDVSLLSAFSDWLMLIDICDGGQDFRYAYYGDGIAEAAKRDMQGRRTSELGGYITTFFTATYRAAMLRKNRVLTEHEPPRSVFVRNWTRMIVPITDSAGDVTRFAVMNLPENDLRSGLDALPVACFAADEAGVLLHANPKGQSCLLPTKEAQARVLLSDMLGISLDLAETAETLLEEKRNLTMSVPDSVKKRVPYDKLSIGAARHVGNAYYLITLS